MAWVPSKSNVRSTPRHSYEMGAQWDFSPVSVFMYLYGTVTWSHASVLSIVVNCACMCIFIAVDSLDQAISHALRYEL
jgi:hypothetical protein